MKTVSEIQVELLKRGYNKDLVLGDFIESLIAEAIAVKSELRDYVGKPQKVSKEVKDVKKKVKEIESVKDNEEGGKF